MERWLALVLLLPSLWLEGCGNETATGPRERPAPVSISLNNEDGFIDRSGATPVFDSSREQFNIGDGSAAQPDSLIYRVEVINNTSVAATGVRVVNRMAPHTAVVACREILASGPEGGANPSSGSVAGTDCSPSGFTWNLGTLGAGSSAVLYFRAEAIGLGDDVNRVTVTSDQTPSFIAEEPILVADPDDRLPALGLSNENGFIDRRASPAVFDSSKYLFAVGNGSDAEPDSLIYRVEIINHAVFVATGVQVTNVIAANAGDLRCRQILATAPDGSPNPSQGMTSGCSGASSSGFTWNIGTLNGGANAVIFFRAEAIQAGNYINRITLSANELSRGVLNEELTTILE